MLEIVIDYSEEFQVYVVWLRVDTKQFKLEEFEHPYSAQTYAEFMAKMLHCETAEELQVHIEIITDDTEKPN